MSVEREMMEPAELICDRLRQYFGAGYEISSNSVDVFSVMSAFKPSVYVESEDIMIVNSIANEFGMAIEKWRLVAANGQVGLYCVLKNQDEVEHEALLMAGSRLTAAERLSA